MAVLQILAGAGVLVVMAFADKHFVAEVRQNFQHEVNNALVKQIQRELIASYMYQSYASYFGRADVALPGFQKFFSEASQEERKHAEILIHYVNERGGFVQYDNIELEVACNATAEAVSENVKLFNGSRERPCICEFLKSRSGNECMEENIQSGLQAMEDALALEHYVNKKLLELHKIADNHKDTHLTHVLEHEFLSEQVSSIRELGGYVTRLRSFKSNYALGEYLFDQNLHKK